MIRNYFKTLLRNMQKHKLHTTINLVGLGVAFTCAILLLLLVYFQFSFDRFHVNGDRLYEIYQHRISSKGDEIAASMSYPVAPTLIRENIGIEKATRIKNSGHGVRYKEKDLDLSTRLVDPDFFSMFSFPVVDGDRVNPLGSEGNVVLSEDAAKRLLGTQEAVGQSVRVNIGGVWKALVVSAVLKDAPKNSSFKFDVLARSELDPEYPLNKDRWDAEQHTVFVQLAPGATQKSVEQHLRELAKKYNIVDTAYLKNSGYLKDVNGDLLSLRLMPLAEIHYNPKLSGNALSKPFLYILLLVAFVILVIACFNFINLNIGLAFTRTKEMGIRKCLGAGKRQVWVQVWGESFFTVFVAMLIGTIVSFAVLRFITKTSRIGISSAPLHQPAFLAILVALLFVVSFAASSYPSFIMSRLRTVEILKGKISLKKPGVFRNALIVVQFVIACVLICATFIIYRQFEHLRNAPLGYTAESLISIPIHDAGTGKEIVNKLRTRLSSQSSIVSVTGTTVNLGVGEDGSTSKSMQGFDFNGRSVLTTWMEADYDILKTLNIKPKEGRDFTTDHVGDSNAVLVTESMAKQLSDKDVINLQFLSDSTQPKWNVVGVIPDFHLYSMHEKAEPLTIALNQSGQLAYALVRVNTQNARATMDLVKNVYAQIEPGVEFKGSYVDENIERWYQSEAALSRMFTIAALVAIVLSCMGLFGIAFIVIKQRVKEIGGRKVLGASVGSVAVLVTKEFIKPVLVAIVIALPIAWWATNKWLQGFEYRISIQWTMFLGAAFVALFIAIATVSFQAIKAATANPVKSLRTE